MKNELEKHLKTTCLLYVLGAVMLAFLLTRECFALTVYADFLNMLKIPPAENYENASSAYFTSGGFFFEDTDTSVPTGCAGEYGRLFSNARSPRSCPFCLLRIRGLSG